MPIVGLADLGLLATAALCLLFAIAFNYIINAIADGLPELKILTFALKLGDIFRNASETALNWMVGNTKALWNDFAKWLLAHAALLEQLGGAIVSAVSHLGDQIAHIVNTSVPNAISSAESYVGKELVTLKKDIESDITASASRVEGILQGDVKALDSTISTDIGTVEGDITRAVTKGVATAENYTDDAINSLRAYVDKAVAQALSTAEGDLNTAKQQIGQAVAGVAATAASQLSAAENTLEGEISAAARTAASDLSGAEQTLGGEITSEAKTAASALAQTASALGGEISSAESELQGQIGQAVGSLTGDITSEAQAFSGDLSNLQSVMTAAIAAAIAGVVSRVAKLEECSVGVCDDSPNNFSNLLSDALGLASLAGVGVFLAKAIDYPADATGEYADTISGLYSKGQDAFSALLSL